MKKAKILILILLLFMVETVKVKAKESNGYGDSLDIEAKYAVLLDYDTMDILYKKNMNEITAPSSTTKLMTAYIIFDLLEENKINLNDKFKVSIRAWRQEGTRMFLEPEWKISVDELLKGLIIVSGNDAAVVLAEGAAGNIDDFVVLMNKKAKELGMENTNFVNPNGLYEKNHFMSVYDLGLLSRALIKNHRKYYKRYFSQKSYSFNNISQKNRNWLLEEYEGADGLKTGFTDYGKYSVSASAIRHGKRLIAVVNGADSERSRINQAKRLLDYGFSNYSYIDLYKSADTVGQVSVLFGKNKKVYAYTKEDISYAAKKEDVGNLKVKFVSNKYLQAPIKRDTKIAEIHIIDGNYTKKFDLFAEDDVEVATKFRKIKSLFLYNSKKLVGIE